MCISMSHLMVARCIVFMCYCVKKDAVFKMRGKTKIKQNTMRKEQQVMKSS